MKSLQQHINENLNHKYDEIFFAANKNWKEVLNQFVKDCKVNGIFYEKLSTQRFKIEISDKASTAIRLAKERLGSQNINVKPFYTVPKGGDVLCKIENTIHAFIITSPSGKTIRVSKDTSKFKDSDKQLLTDFYKINTIETLGLNVNQMKQLQEMSKIR
jgi:DNA-binding transcriptional regulator YhcF (GntR family)